MTGRRSRRFRRLAFELVVYGTALFAFYLARDQTRFNSTPRAPIPIDLIASLVDLRSELPPGSALWHSWSYGYLISDVTGFATYHDGFSPDAAISQLMSRAVTSADPKELHQIFSFISNEGQRGIKRVFEGKLSYSAVLEEIEASYRPVEGNVHLLFTERALQEFAEYFYKGQWDFVRATGERTGFVFQRCWPANQDDLRSTDTLRCAMGEVPNYVIDLANGMVAQRLPIKKALWIRGGSVAREIEYPHESEFYMQLLEGEGEWPMDVQLMPEVVFRSNMNQMYMLGAFDRELFEEVYNDFPVARVFRVKAREGNRTRTNPKGG